jgi:hypothetical protein
MTKGRSKEFLTNERLTHNYVDNFSLALATMDHARNMIHAGRDFTLAALLEDMTKKKVYEKKDKEELLD